MSHSSSSFAWYLESFASTTGALQRAIVDSDPFSIGRLPGLSLTLASAEVSGRHAEIVFAGDAIAVRDTGSTNGTFVNRERLSGTQVLADGDVLHIADVEFRVVREEGVADFAPEGTVPIADLELPRKFSGFAAELRSLLDAEAVEIRFEPIVRLSDGAAMAAEALARGASEELPQAPTLLFRLAAEAGLAPELSRLCRAKAVAAVDEALPAAQALFLNTHPDEMADPETLAASVAELRASVGERPLVLEIHESAVTDPAAISDLRQRLEASGVGLAYDDFGAGQPRLLELAEAPPDYLKLDRSLVCDLDRAAAGRRQVVAALVAMAHDLGIATIAEGLGSAEEADACKEVGFIAVQGRGLPF